MLYLGAGVRDVKVSETRTMQVFPDFSDPKQFYYLPNFPRIAQMDDGSPAIRLLIFRKRLDEVAPKTDDAVAFLSLDVDLRWDPALVEKARGVISLEDRLNDKPRLVPIFFRQGTVKLMLLDSVTPDEGAAHKPDATPSEFVTKIMGAGSPSLYGDNRAIFQASLSKNGAAALSGALDGVTPIGVVYTLTFAGLQPAFNIRAKVDWQKIYDHFSEDENMNFLFYERDIQKVIDKFREDKVITFESTIEGVGAEAMDAEREEVMTAVRQMIFEKFFEATFKRETAAGQSTADDVTGVLKQLAKSGVTLGMGYTYKRKEVHVEELRTLDLDWTARKAAERTIYPQAHMNNLLTGSGITHDKLITIVDGSDTVWNSQPFEVHTTADWEGDGIAGVSVDIEYDDPKTQTARDWSTFLNKEKDKDLHRDWMDRTTGNGFRYKYEVIFQDTKIPGPRPTIKSGSGWREHEGTVLVVHPGELYETVEMEVGAVPKFPFDRWPAVQAILRYRSANGSFEHYESGVLKVGSDRFTTRFRIDKGDPGQREVSLHYVGATGEKVETGWMPMPQDQWVVEDPHGADLVVRAIVAGKRDNIANLLVDLRYDDDENGIHEEGSFAFDTDNISKPQNWTVARANPKLSRYQYRMTLVTKSGDFIQTGWIGTDAPSIPVGEVYVKRLMVQMETSKLGPNVEAIVVDLAYAEGTLNDRKQFRLAGNDHAEWQLDLQDASKRNYQITTTWVRSDGFNTKIGPSTSSETFVPIAGSPPEQH